MNTSIETTTAMIYAAAGGPGEAPMMAPDEYFAQVAALKGEIAALILTFFAGRCLAFDLQAFPAEASADLDQLAIDVFVYGAGCTPNYGGNELATAA